MSDITIPEDRQMAHVLRDAITGLRADQELVDLIGGADRIAHAKQARQRDDPINIMVERVNTSSAWTGNHYRTFHVIQTMLVLTRPEWQSRDPLYPEVVNGRIADVMATAVPAGTWPRGRDDAGGLDITNDDADRRPQWPQRFRVLAHTDS